MYETTERGLHHRPVRRPHRRHQRQRPGRHPDRPGLPADHPGAGGRPRHQRGAGRPAVRHGPGGPGGAGSAEVHPLLRPGLLPLQAGGSRTRTIPTTGVSWRSSRSTTCATSSTTAATTPWTPATRSPNTCSRCGYDCRVIGVPKTIDNDLSGTDHCPGFGSAAKYIATSCMEVYQDARVYDTGTVTIVEIMGRHAGWLAGAAALATCARLQAPTWCTCPKWTSTWTSSWPT